MKPIVNSRGDTYWYKYGELHRDGAPAIVYKNGNEEWLQHGKLHRLDGPAGIYNDGTEEWYKEGLLHRLDGPAVTYANSEQKWYVAGYRCRDRNEFQEQSGLSDEEIALLVLKYGGMPDEPMEPEG